VGCVSPFENIDRSLAARARVALMQERPPGSLLEEGDEIEPYEEEGGKSVIIGELLAIFPGFFWHGLGHDYAGDHRTARQIRKAGQLGYLFTALGTGLLVGGYYLDQEDDTFQSYAISLYVTGGITGGIGVGFWLTSWIYDIIDTPRAISSGGRPPPKSLFQKEFEALE